MLVEGDPFGRRLARDLPHRAPAMRCASGDEVADAADFGLAAVRDAGIESSVLATSLLCNVALARINEGAIGSASRLIRPRTHDAPRQATRFLHLARAWIEVLRGDLEPADRRLAAVADLTHGVSAHRQLLVTVQAHCDLWRGLPAVALEHVRTGIAGETVTCWTPYTGALLVLAARAAADIGQADPSPSRGARRDAGGLAPPVELGPARPRRAPRGGGRHPQHVAGRARQARRHGTGDGLDRGRGAVGPRRPTPRRGVLPVAGGRARAQPGLERVRGTTAEACARPGAWPRPAPGPDRPEPGGPPGGTTIPTSRARRPSEVRRELPAC